MATSRVMRVARAIDELPSVPRYVAYGALIVEGMVCAMIILQFGAVVGGDLPWWGPLGALAIGPVLGGFAGLVYGMLGVRLRRKGRVGAYVAGIVTVAAYLFPFAAVFWVPMVRDIGLLATVIVWGGTLLFFGSMVGVSFAKSR